MLKSIEYVDISAWFAWVLVIVLAVQFASGPKRGAQYLFLLFFWVLCKQFASFVAVLPMLGNCWFYKWLALLSAWLVVSFWDSFPRSCCPGSQLPRKAEKGCLCRLWLWDNCFSNHLHGLWLRIACSIGGLKASRGHIVFAFSSFKPRFSLWQPSLWLLGFRTPLT